MRYNPWIEVNRGGQAARRKAYSAGRLPDPINRQFIALQAEDECILCRPTYRTGRNAFFLPDLRAFKRSLGAPNCCNKSAVQAR
jgi:hypothetical protein